MQKQGWLQDPKTKNTKRFHRDERSWFRYPKVFIDSGRPLPNEHALLKSRSYVALREAEEEWMQFRKEGSRKSVLNGVLILMFRSERKIVANEELTLRITNAINEEQARLKTPTLTSASKDISETLSLKT